MTLFDRYLVWNFLVTFCILFATTYGLFVVGDLVDNVDDFTAEDADDGAKAIATRIAIYYSYQGLFFLNFIGRPLILIALGVSLLVIRRRKELTPLLAAGIPIRRLCIPFLAGAMLTDAALAANRELVVPQIAHHKHDSRGKQGETRHSARAAYDYSSGVLIRGSQLLLHTKTLLDAEFVLSASTLATELTVLKSPKAVFQEATDDQPAGWLLKQPNPPFEQLQLTEAGRRVFLPMNQGRLIFVKTPVDCEMLYGKGGSPNLLSTKELLARIQNPAFSSRPLRGYTMEAHSRLIAPLMALGCAIIVFIFMFRRESSGLVMDVWLGLVALASVYGLQQLLQFVGNAGLVEPALATWIPFAYTGLIVSWNIDRVQT